MRIKKKKPLIYSRNLVAKAYIIKNGDL